MSSGSPKSGELASKGLDLAAQGSGVRDQDPPGDIVREVTTRRDGGFDIILRPHKRKGERPFHIGAQMPAQPNNPVSRAISGAPAHLEGRS